LTTGPSHIFLSLTLSTDSDSSEPEIKAIGNGDTEAAPKPLSADVLEQVRAGVDEANTEFHTCFHVTKIEYIENDTLDIAAYRHLSKSIIAEAAKHALRYPGPCGQLRRE
jgi:hypothetical protein